MEKGSQIATASSVIVAGLWIASVGAGIAVLSRHSGTPAAPHEALEDWPRESLLPKPSGRFALLVFLHPRCPCSEATLGELERLLPALRGTAEITVLFVTTESERSLQASSRTWRAALALPDAHVLVDSGAREAGLFHAETSGEVLFFDRSGKIAFQGGITPARGHRGDSAGRDSILAAARGLSVPQRTAPAFGCGLKKSAGKGA